MTDKRTTVAVSKPATAVQQVSESNATCAKYVRRPVCCSHCGWRGHRGYRLTWPACPQCNAPAWLVSFINTADQGKEPASPPLKPHRDPWSEFCL